MIVGDKVILRAIEGMDLYPIARWREDPEIGKFFYEEVSISMPMQEVWFQKLLADPTRTMWCIQDKASDILVGIVGLYCIDLRSRKAVYGPLLIGNKDFAGRGYARETENLILEYAFNYLNLNKLYAEVLGYSTSVLKLHKHSGFKVDGVLREHVFKGGEYQDVVALSMLRKEYTGMKGE